MNNLASTGLLPVCDDMELLLSSFPEHFRYGLEALSRDVSGLVEIVADLGRRPQARFQDELLEISSKAVSYEDLDYAVDRIGDFSSDNRAGIEASLHRISCIRNRRGDIVGLTARVGRAVHGVADILSDIIAGDHSILMLGFPGVGKTTLLREVARVMADEHHRRVVIVDTSNEIGGDGDIPHPGIGSARRMQVPDPSRQHDVMIEAVENHMPEIVVIDEIGTETETYAARTIAERGVRLVATAHGNRLENLLANPTLSDLVGGIESVTLSDEEAHRRKSRKAVLERKATSTFDVIVEIRDRNTFVIHNSVDQTVDALLRGLPVDAEVRVREPNGSIRKTHTGIYSDYPGTFTGDRKNDRVNDRVNDLVNDRVNDEKITNERFTNRISNVPKAIEAAKELAGEPAARYGYPERRDRYATEDGYSLAPAPPGATVVEGARIFPFAISRNRLQRAIESMSLRAEIARHWEDCDFCLTLKGTEKRLRSTFEKMRANHVPVYTLRANTTAQIQVFLEEQFRLPSVKQRDLALREVREGIACVQASGQPVDLSAMGPSLRRTQHELVTKAGLSSRSYGVEPQRHVRIFMD